MDDFMMANAVLSKFSRNYMALKKGLPVRPSEMGVLNIITQTPGPHTPMMLAEMLGVTKQMVAAHLSVLGKAGYVKKQQSLEDKRVFYVMPTEKAVRLVEKEKKRMDELLGEMVGYIGSKEFYELVFTVERMNRFMEEHCNGSE